MINTIDREEEKMESKPSKDFDLIAELQEIEKDSSSPVPSFNKKRKSYFANIDDYYYDREFILGIGNDNLIYEKLNKLWHYDFVMEKEYILWKFITLNNPPSTLQFYFKQEKSINTDDDNDNNYSLMLTGINIDNDFFVGQKPDEIDEKHINTISNFKYFKSIEIQYFYMRFQRSRHFVFLASHYLCGINYIKLIDQNDDIYTFGKEEIENKVNFCKDDGGGNDNKFSNTFKSYSSYIFRETGNLFFAGIITSKSGILGLQIVDMVEEHADNHDGLYFSYRMLNNQGIHSIEYEQFIHSIDYQSDENSRYRRIVNYSSLNEKYPIYFENFICCEDKDIINLFNRICGYTMYDDNPSYNIIPEYLNIIELCLDGDITKYIQL